MNMNVSSWAIRNPVPVILLFILTGYGMTKQIMDPALARLLHGKILPIPLFVSLLIHGGICARNSLRRAKVFQQNAATDVYVVVIGLCLFGLFLWLYFRG